MTEMKMRAADTELLRLPKNQKGVKETTGPDLKRSPVRHFQKARSVVDDTFAALPLRTHTRIQQLIAQAKYGE